MEAAKYTLEFKPGMMTPSFDKSFKFNAISTSKLRF